MRYGVGERRAAVAVSAQVAKRCRLERTAEEGGEVPKIHNFHTNVTGYQIKTRVHFFNSILRKHRTNYFS